MGNVPSAGLLLLLASTLPSCGGNPAKAGLLAYESAMEVTMAEDGRVSASLSDLKEDLFAANARSVDQARFARETAGPFYDRFRAAAAAAPTADPRLEEVHGILLQYVDHRVAYLAAIETCLATAETGVMRKLLEATIAVQEVREAFRTGTGGKMDREAADAATTVQLFVERVLEAFRNGKVDLAYVQKALGEQVQPRLLRVAARLVPAGPEPEAAVDRAVVAWARGELAFFKVLEEALPVQEKAQQALRDTEDHWAQAEALRAKYLRDLGAYRESIR